MKKDKITILITVLIISSLIFFITSNILQKENSIKSCLKKFDYNSTKPGFYPGEIIVEFYPNVTKEQAKSLFDFYKLKSYAHREYLSGSYSYRIIVSNETEYQWICQLTIFHDGIIKQAILNYVSNPE